MNSLETVRAAIEAALAPGHFLAAAPMRLEWEHVPQGEIAWEIFRGQLVQPHLTREKRIFESWNIFSTDTAGRSGQPLIAMRLDAVRGELHVVRGLLCYAWEGYHAGDGVYLSREVERWVSELAGTLQLADFAGENALRAALGRSVFHAVVGLSRLPLTSVESPLPTFSLGQIAYFLSASHSPSVMTSWRNLMLEEGPAWPAGERTKWLEGVLRSIPATDLAELAGAWQLPGRDTVALLRAVFNDVALSPYTDFVDKTLALLRLLVDRQQVSATEHVDFLSYLLRQLARHLIAYDLVTFHHRGANYPDALLLDAALKDYLRLIEQHPHWFEGDEPGPRLRRRALRLAWLHRRRYEGHPVPDAPTSSGESMRVLPPPHVRVPEEQIVNLGKRKQRLYQGDPLPSHAGAHAQAVLVQCGRDLQTIEEVRELGMGLFIERPLGMARAPGEPDPSPLLTHEAFSRSLAERALGELGRELLLGISAPELAHCRALLADVRPSGIAAATLPTHPPRVVSLADAARAARDFVVLRTLPGSVRAFFNQPEVAAKLRDKGFDPASVAGNLLIVGGVTRAGTPGVLLYRDSGQCILELEI